MFHWGGSDHGFVRAGDQFVEVRYFGGGATASLASKTNQRGRSMAAADVGRSARRLCGHVRSKCMKYEPNIVQCLTPASRAAATEQPHACTRRSWDLLETDDAHARQAHHHRRMFAAAPKFASVPCVRASGGPIAGLRVVQFAGVGPGLFAGTLRTDSGGNAVVFDRPALILPYSRRLPSQRGRRSVVLDPKLEAARDVVRRLLERTGATQFAAAIAVIRAR